MAEAPLLELRDVETRYGLSRVLFGVSLAVAPGEMVSLMGRNGMGKTTTVRSIMGLTPAAAGSIRFAGGEIRQLPAYRVAKLGIGLSAGRAPAFSQPHDARKSRRHGVKSRRRRRAVVLSNASGRCFLGLPNAPAAWPICCPAASSRCWRSAAR